MMYGGLYQHTRVVLYINAGKTEFSVVLAVSVPCLQMDLLVATAQLPSG